MSSKTSIEEHKIGKNTHKNKSEDSLWALPGQSWEAFGDSFGRWGLGGVLGTSWVSPGQFLGRSWEGLGRAWEDFGGDKGKSPKNE